VDHDLVGLFDFAQGATGVTVLSAGWLSTCNPQGFWRGFVQAVTGGWLAGVFAIERQSALKMLDAILQHHHLRHEVLHWLLQRPQHPNQLILLRVTELGEVGQVLHRSRLSLHIS
jgi:hypothetical protein